MNIVLQIIGYLALAFGVSSASATVWKTYKYDTDSYDGELLSIAWFVLAVLALK